MNDRIEELQEMKDEYILNETSLEIGQKSVSWGELAELQAIAESKWDNTPEGQELKALLWAEGNEKTMSLYYALKALVNCPDYRGIRTHEMRQAENVIHQAEGN